MDWVPEFQKENLVADREPLPPPVPPKRIEDGGSHGQDSYDMLYNHQMVLEAVATTYADDLLPVLPPKPKNWLVIIKINSCSSYISQILKS